MKPSIYFSSVVGFLLCLIAQGCAVQQTPPDKPWLSMNAQKSTEAKCLGLLRGGIDIYDLSILKLSDDVYVLKFRSREGPNRVSKHVIFNISKSEKGKTYSVELTLLNLYSISPEDAVAEEKDGFCYLKLETALIQDLRRVGLWQYIKEFYYKDNGVRTKIPFIGGKWEARERGSPFWVE